MAEARNRRRPRGGGCQIPGDVTASTTVIFIGFNSVQDRAADKYAIAQLRIRRFVAPPSANGMTLVIPGILAPCTGPRCRRVHTARRPGHTSRFTAAATYRRGVMCPDLRSRAEPGCSRSVSRALSGEEAERQAGRPQQQGRQPGRRPCAVVELRAPIGGLRTACASKARKRRATLLFHGRLITSTRTVLGTPSPPTKRQLGNASRFRKDPDQRGTAASSGVAESPRMSRGAAR